MYRLCNKKASTLYISQCVGDLETRSNPMTPLSFLPACPLLYSALGLAWMVNTVVLGYFKCLKSTSRLPWPNTWTSHEFDWFKGFIYSVLFAFS